MKTKKIFSISLLPLLMLSLQQCDESSPQPKPLTELEKLPPVTQSGEHTFGCLVDGKAWVTKLAGDSQSDYQGGLLSVFADVHNQDFNSVMKFYLTDGTLSEKTYQFTEKKSPAQYAQYYNYTTNCGFVTTTVITGSVTITHIDKIKFIISGTFEFEASSDAYQSPSLPNPPNCSNKIVKITDGRFDINYAP